MYILVLFSLSFYSYSSLQFSTLIHYYRSPHMLHLICYSQSQHSPVFNNNVYHFPPPSLQGEVDSRLMGGILTGVRRCQPFLSETACQALQAQAHPLHRLVHLAGYTVALQALALLQQMGPTDR